MITTRRIPLIDGPFTCKHALGSVRIRGLHLNVKPFSDLVDEILHWRIAAADKRRMQVTFRRGVLVGVNFPDILFLPMLVIAFRSFARFKSRLISMVVFVGFLFCSGAFLEASIGG